MVHVQCLYYEKIRLCITFKRAPRTRHPPFALNRPRVGSIAIVQDRARDLSYPSWRLIPIYDPDPTNEAVEGMQEGGRLFEDRGECLGRYQTVASVRACICIYTPLVLYDGENKTMARG